MRTAIVGLIALGLALLGCAAPPNWCQPGSEPVQQRRAERHDPYPELDAGPEIIGGRPRSYDRPRTEPRRAQSDAPPPGGLGPAIFP
jgi:hypothetical protein